MLKTTWLSMPHFSFRHNLPLISLRLTETWKYYASHATYFRTTVPRNTPVLSLFALFVRRFLLVCYAVWWIYNILSLAIDILCVKDGTRSNNRARAKAPKFDCGRLGPSIINKDMRSTASNHRLHSTHNLLVACRVLKLLSYRNETLSHSWFIILGLAM